MRARIFLAYVFDTNVVENEAEHYWPPLVLKKYGSVWKRVVVVFNEALGEKIVL